MTMPVPQPNAHPLEEQNMGQNGDDQAYNDDGQ